MTVYDVRKTCACGRGRRGKNGRGKIESKLNKDKKQWTKTNGGVTNERKGEKDERMEEVKKGRKINK